MRRHAYHREEADDDAFDENGLLRDGKSVRVPLFMRDSLSPLQRAVSSFAASVTSGPHRPGFRLAAADAERTSALDAAYADYEEDLARAYKNPVGLGGGRTSGDAEWCPDCDGDGEVAGARCGACDGIGAVSASREEGRRPQTPDAAVRARDSAYRDYEAQLVNAYRGNRPDAAEGSGVTRDDLSSADHQQRMAQLYADSDAELSRAWRRA